MKVTGKIISRIEIHVVIWDHLVTRQYVNLFSHMGIHIFWGSILQHPGWLRHPLSMSRVMS